MFSPLKGEQLKNLLDKLLQLFNSLSSLEGSPEGEG